MMSGPSRWLQRTVILAALWVVAAGSGRLAAQRTPDSHAVQYVQQRWESAQGLPNDSIEAIVQTRDGYLWAATERGLTRFDGSHFDSFSRTNAPALRENYVSALAQTSDGTLWVGTTLNGLAAYRDGAFRAVALPVAGLQGKVTAIGEDHAGAIWVCTSNHGIFRMADGHAQPVGADDGLARTSPENRGARAFAIDPQGTVWIGTDSGGVASWDGRRFVLRLASATFHGAAVGALFADQAGTLWMASGREVYSFRPDEPHATPQLAATSRGRVRTLYAAPASQAAGKGKAEAELWIGTETLGLELHRGDVTTYFDGAHGFDIDTVQQVYRDREGSTWVATDGFGLVQLRVATFRTINDPAAFADDNIRSVTRSGGTSFWIGTGSGLSRYAEGSIHPYKLTGTVPNVDFRALLEDREGTLWIGTDGAGVLRLRRGEHRAESLDLALPSPVVLSLAEDSRGHLWIGTTQGLVERSGDRSHTYTAADGVPSDVVLALLADRKGRLWLGGPQGLATVADGKVLQQNSGEGSPADTVVCFLEDREGEIWIGAVDGLYRVTGHGFEHWTTEDGLFSNMVNDIQEDLEGNLWLRSNSEISRLRRADLLAVPQATLHAAKYDHEDGIEHVVAGGGTPGSVGLGDGTLWFGSHRGLIGVDPGKMGDGGLKPPVVLSEFLADGARVPLRPNEKLPPGGGSLEFHFAALSFVEHNNLRFRYQLVGFDTQWVEAGNRTAAFYTNIPPGTYTFRVVAANRDGNWNSEGAALPFTLKAHFYQTLWFGLLTVLISVTGLSYLLLSRIRRREEKLVARQHELEALVLQRTALLEEEKQQLVAVREDLKNQARRDSMTGLLNRGAILAMLELELIRSTRTGVPLGVAMIDIDHFKAVNDSYGHLVGDEVIRQVSARLLRTVRPYDGVGRYGGEEFLVILPQMDKVENQARVERLHRMVGGEPVTTDLLDEQFTLNVTCSIGVSVYSGEGKCDAEALLGSADLALYEAKRAGRNRVVVYESGNRSDLVPAVEG